jgi:hypothetical protein
MMRAKAELKAAQAERSMASCVEPVERYWDSKIGERSAGLPLPG